MSQKHLLPTSMFQNFKLPAQADKIDYDIARLRQLDVEFVKVNSEQLNILTERYFGRLDLNQIVEFSHAWSQRPERFQLWMMCSESVGAASRKLMYLNGQQGARGYISSNEHELQSDFDLEFQNPLVVSFVMFHQAMGMRHTLLNPDALTIELRQGFEGIGRHLEDLGFRVRRNREVNRFLLQDRHISKQPLSTSNKILENLLAPSSQHPPLYEREEVETLASLIIRENLADPDFSLEALAQALCMSPRSLQRKLAIQGLTFSTLRDRERSNIIIKNMESGMSKEAIGTLLGYTDLSSIYKFISKNAQKNDT